MFSLDDRMIMELTAVGTRIETAETVSNTQRIRVSAPNVARGAPKYPSFGRRLKHRAVGYIRRRIPFDSAVIVEVLAFSSSTPL